MSLAKTFATLAFLLTLFLPAVAQDTKPEIANKSEAKARSGKVRIPADSKIFIAKMEGELDQFITPEVMKRKLPVVIVTDENQADYIITGVSVKGEHRWYDTVFTGMERDKNQGSIQVVDVKERRVVWAAEAGDRSLWWGALKKGGRRKVAERLVGKMKSQLFKP